MYHILAVVHIKRLREKLGDDPQDAQLIRTVRLIKMNV